MSFSFSHTHLLQLARLNSFPLPEEGMVFFGFRGCLPVADDDQGWSNESRVDLAALDYWHPRCTLGQWRMRDGAIALFPGSTVPYIELVRKAARNEGRGANQLLTGFYRDYRKGIHKAGSKTAHQAFRQTEAHAIRRTSDDLDFDLDDRVEYDNPYDNIHAAWCMGVSQDHYSSAGCQVIVGFPKAEGSPGSENRGPWRTFHDNAYALDQDSFPYMLLEGRDLLRVACAEADRVAPRLRFGSLGAPVERLQEALRRERFYEGRIDGDFRGRTLRAVLAFQTARFGPLADDGIVGPITESALGITRSAPSRIAMGPGGNGRVGKRSRPRASRNRRRRIGTR